MSANRNDFPVESEWMALAGGNDWSRPKLRSGFDARSDIVERKPSACEDLTVAFAVQIGEPVREFDFFAIKR